MAVAYAQFSNYWKKKSHLYNCSQVSAFMIHLFPFQGSNQTVLNRCNRNPMKT